jgi:CDP-6-deoxy-D-xylo-4-hexulose-3-dehydrase
LEEKGIQTRRLFGGNLLKHPCFTNMSREDEWYRVIGDLHNTNRIMRDTFWIGVYPGMTDEKLDYMISMIKEALA